uniref:NYN domain-containing protein n=1 Tax=Tanacetum cinerariifolium TaxID=118510 RepID=A0A699J5R5_TANCI|nr:hypothetical protein [Tanacetum cinerariifolium]
MASLSHQLPPTSKVGIFWDLLNYHAAKLYKVVNDLKNLIRKMLPNVELCITMYGESQQISLVNSKDCVDAGVRLLNIPCVGKNDADRVIMCDMYVFAFDSPPPLYVMLISGDEDFISAFKGLRDLGYTALLRFRKDRASKKL